MSLTVDSFERCCRLCAEQQEVTIMLFSEEAEAMLLKKKLNKYLLIEVDEDDKLPKNICITCCSKLQMVCEFIDKAIKAQEILQKQSYIVEQTVEFSNLKSIKVEQECEDDLKFTSMEVSVDPMMVLQNCEDVLSPATEEISDIDEQDVTHLHSVDGEDVTIKLIKKRDKTLEEHNLNNESDLKPFPCPTCNRGFHTELALKNHSWVHKQDVEIKPYNCAYCDDVFDNKTELLAHLKVHNTNGVCLICGRRFRSDMNLAAHMVGHDSRIGKSYTCKVCGRSYYTSSNLKTHSVTHSDERPYKCQFCKKCFKRNQDLKFHINQHTGEKPYKCPFCDKRFASSGNCYSHKSRMHPGRRTEGKNRKGGAITRQNPPLQFRPIAPKPVFPVVKTPIKYQCTLCEHSFVKRDNFTYHMYQHTGEKPFHCSFCSEKFVTRRGLLIHHDKTHPGKDRPLALLSKNVLLK